MILPFLLSLAGCPIETHLGSTLDSWLGRWQGDLKVARIPYHTTGKVLCLVGTDPKGSAQYRFCTVCGAPGKAEIQPTLTKDEDESLTGITPTEFYPVPDIVIFGD